MEIGVVTNTEERGGEQAKAAPQTVAGWKPCHIIMGGWDPKTPREQVLRDTSKWIEQFAGADNSPILAPYTPKKYCVIVKLRAMPENVAAISCRFQKAIKEEERALPPTWVATERSPAKGARKRSIREAVDRVRAEYPMLDVDSTYI